MTSDDRSKPSPGRREADARRVDAAPRKWSSADLLGDQREAVIEHAGEVYRLRLTANNKLILTK